MAERRVPRIRFKGFEEDWEQRKLGEIGTVMMCRRIFKNQTSESGEIPFYKIGTFGGVADAFITRALFEEYRLKYPFPEKGDVLISASGSIGRTVEYTGEEAYFQDSNIVWLKHDESVISTFLRNAYEVVKWSGVEGSTIKRLYNDNILRTRIKIPTISEQEKIARFLDGFDMLLSLHQRKLEKLKILKKAMLEKMFPKNGEKVPEIRFSGFADDWEQRKLEDFAAETRGGGTPATSNGTYWNGDIPWIQSSDLKEDELFEVKPRKYVSKIGLSKSATQLVEANSIAVVTRVGVGKLALMPHSYTTSQDFLSLSQLQVEPYFAVYSIYHLLQEELEVVQGTSIKGLTKEDLLSKSLLIPVDMGEQTQLGGLFYKLDSLISLHQRKLEKLRQIKKSMLERMFV